MTLASFLTIVSDESLTSSGRICKLHPKEALCISRERKYFIHCTVLVSILCVCECVSVCVCVFVFVQALLCADLLICDD